MALNLPRIISGAVSIAHSITESIQDTITILQWNGNDQWGNPSTAYTSVQVLALIEQKVESKFEKATGRVIQTQAKLTILEPIPVNNTAGRINPIDNRDKVVLPDGSTGPVYRPEGLINPDTNAPFLIELWIGM